MTLIAGIHARSDHGGEPMFDYNSASYGKHHLIFHSQIPTLLHQNDGIVLVFDRCSGEFGSLRIDQVGSTTSVALAS